MRAIPLLASLAACGGGVGDAPTWHADVAPIVEGRCASCHDAGSIGPFPLTTYAEVVDVGEIVAHAVENRTMPPWGAGPADVTYAGDWSLTDEQIATVVAWVDAGMPEGDPADATAPLTVDTPALERVDHTLAVPEPYHPGTDGPDDYRCFLVDWPGTELEYVTGFEVVPDNTSVVHHVAAFLVRPDNPLGASVFDEFARFDDEVEGPGYTCYGGPSGSEELAIPIQQVAQWVPGNGATLFPEGVGIPVPPGSKVVLQMHYNTPAWDGEPDQSTVAFQTAPTVERVGAFAPYLDAAWTFGSMVLPPNSTTTYEEQGDPVPFFELLLSDIDLSRGFDIHAAMLHLHQLGDSGRIRVDRASGESLTILNVEDWDFDWQFNYQLSEPVPFRPGDALHLSCTWTNDTDVAVEWGEGSGDEMCVGNLFVSEPAP